MNKRIIHLSLAVMMLIGGGCTTTQHTEGFPPLQMTTTSPERITLKTVGAPGQRFSVTLLVDGSRREISGVTPAEFPLECVVLVGDVTKVDGDANFSFMIERHNMHGLFYTPSVQTLHRFRYYSGSIGILAGTHLINGEGRAGVGSGL